MSAKALETAIKLSTVINANKVVPGFGVKGRKSKKMYKINRCVEFIIIMYPFNVTKDKARELKLEPKSYRSIARARDLELES